MGERVQVLGEQPAEVGGAVGLRGVVGWGGEGGVYRGVGGLALRGQGDPGQERGRVRRQVGEIGGGGVRERGKVRTDALRPVGGADEAAGPGVGGRAVGPGQRRRCFEEKGGQRAFV